jgi:hypothetical protein
MIRKTFEWRLDPDSGEFGWIEKNQPTFNAADGRMVAHDTLEHFAPNYLPVTEEAMALGALIHVREQGGWFSNLSNPDPVFHLSADVSRLLQDIAYGEGVDPVSITRPIRDESVEGLIQEVIQEAHKELLGEGDMVTPAMTSSLTSWMRIGYRRAVRRYHDNSPWHLTCLFQRIADEIDEDHKHGDFNEELKVAINARTLEHRITRSYPEDRYA